MSGIEQNGSSGRTLEVEKGRPISGAAPTPPDPAGKVSRTAPPLPRTIGDASASRPAVAPHRSLPAGSPQGAGGASQAPGGVGGSAAGNTSSASPHAAPGSSPPDLGNYDSAVGKHVLVLRSWDDTAIMTRRVELQGRLATTSNIKARDELRREYEALEWVARERNLALPKDPGEEAAPQARQGGWEPSTAQGTRAMLEREMAAGTGYNAAKEHAQVRMGYLSLPQTPADHDRREIADQQTELMDHDAAAFRASFRTEAKQTAISMLDASSVAIDTVLRSYGLAGGTFRLSDAARKVAADPGSLDAEVDKWVALSQRLNENHAPFAVGRGNREALAREAQQLRDLQDSIAALSREQQRLIALEHAQHPQHAGMPRPKKQPDLSKLESMAGKSNSPASDPFELLRRVSKPAAAPEQQLVFVQVALKARQDQFRTSWINAEREHPVLAAYRAGKPPDASTLAGIGSDEATTRSVIKQVLPKLGNILRTKTAVMGAGLDPVQLPPVVELTKQRMFVAEGSYRDRAVHDMVEQAHDKHDVAHWAFEAVLLGMTMLTLVPSGGTSAMAGLALTGLAYDLYTGLGEYEDFKLQSAASDTDLDKIRSLSDTEPSLTPLLIRMVSAGVNFTIAAGLFKQAIALRRMGGAVDQEAFAALNNAGEEAGVHGLGDEAVAAERSDARSSLVTGGEPPARHPTGKTGALDARPRVTGERLPDLSQQLGMPVAIDNTGTLRDGIELHYVLGPNRTLKPTMMRVGREAIIEDILAHGSIAARVTRYNGALGKLRELWDRIVALVKGAPQPLKPGTPAWTAFEEMRKLDELIALRQSTRMSNGVVSPEILDREIEFFEGYRRHYEAIVGDAEKAGTAGKEGAGHIDSPDSWRDALGEGPDIDKLHEKDVHETRASDRHDRHAVEGRKSPAPKEGASAADVPAPAERTELAKHIPPAGDAFIEWWDSLTPKELDKLLADKSVQGRTGASGVIADHIRHPGNKHEWLMVAEARKFKEWGVSMRTIQDGRSFTDATIGQRFRHGGPGSGVMHRELRAMIRSSDSYDAFLEKLNRWADREMVPSHSARWPNAPRLGRYSLPDNLQVQGQ